MLTRISENYLRVISELVDKKGYARPIDISTALNVKPSSVTEMVRKLAETGLVKYEKRGPIVLTTDGTTLATSIRMRYQVFIKLFEMAGISKQTAYMDACYIEHHLSEETISKLVDFVEKIEKSKS